MPTCSRGVPIGGFSVCRDDGVYDVFLLFSNAALGLGDSNDRTHPDHVVILKKDAPLPARHTVEERFQSVKVRSATMSKLHTGTKVRCMHTRTHI